MVADNYRLLLVCCLVASALAGVVVADATGPESRQVREQRTLYDPAASVSHGADVVADTSVYERDRLENRPVYFANVTPVVSGNVTVGHRGDARLNTTVETAVVLRAVGETDGAAGSGDERTVYWQRAFERRTASATLDGGEQLQVRYAVNATRMFERVERIQSRLDSSAGESQVFLRATVHRRGQVAGRTVEQTEQFRVRFTGDRSAVQVEPRNLDATPVTVTEERTVTERPGGPVLVATLVGAGCLWLLTLGLVGAGVAARHRDERIAPTDAERARSRFERERDEFAEWITAGTVPPSVRDRPTVGVDSLTGLVDVAIDTDSRVIESTDDGRFYVPDGELCYVYDPPKEPDEANVLAPASDGTEAADTDEGRGTFEFPDAVDVGEGPWGESSPDGSDDGTATSDDDD